MVRNIMLQNCLYSNNFIIVRLPTQNVSYNCYDVVGCTRSHPDVDPGMSHTKSRGRNSIHSHGKLRSSNGTIRAHWILYIRINVRGQRTESLSPPLIHVFWLVVMLDTVGVLPAEPCIK